MKKTAIFCKISYSESFKILPPANYSYLRIKTREESGDFFSQVVYTHLQSSVSEGDHYSREKWHLINACRKKHLKIKNRPAFIISDPKLSNGSTSKSMNILIVTPQNIYREFNYIEKIVNYMIWFCTFSSIMDFIVF